MSNYLEVISASRSQKLENARSLHYVIMITDYTYEPPQVMTSAEKTDVIFKTVVFYYFHWSYHLTSFNLCKAHFIDRQS